MNWKGWWALDAERREPPRPRRKCVRPKAFAVRVETASGLRQLYYRTQETCPKKKNSSADAQPLKGASDFEAVTASLKRCPDTNRVAKAMPRYETGIAKAIL